MSPAPSCRVADAGLPPLGRGKQHDDSALEASRPVPGFTSALVPLSCSVPLLRPPPPPSPCYCHHTVNRGPGGRPLPSTPSSPVLEPTSCTHLCPILLGHLPPSGVPCHLGRAKQRRAPCPSLSRAPRPAPCGQDYRPALLGRVSTEHGASRASICMTVGENESRLLKGFQK